MSNNPFDTNSNPFADPSVQSASATIPDEYNPFDSGSTAPAYGSYEPPRLSGGIDIKKDKKDEKERPKSPGPEEEAARLREQNVIRREQLLAEREKALELRERQANANNPKAKNWPFACYPLTYHSIEDEIPADHQPNLRFFYALTLATWVALFWNWICMIAIWWTPDTTGAGDTEALWASIYLALGIPGAWRLWYRSVYYAVRDGSAVQWIRFFIFYFAHTGFAIVMGLGIPKTAGAGLFIMFSLFAKSATKTGIAVLVAMILWGIISLASLFLLKKAHGIYKGTGASENVRQEVVQTVASAV